MDRNFLIALVLTTLIIIIYASPQYQHMFGQETTVDMVERETPETEETPEPGQSRPSNVRQDDSETPADTTGAPRPDNAVETEPVDDAPPTVVQVDPGAAVTDILLENETSRITVSTAGGVITSAVLKPWKGDEGEEPVQLVEEGHSWYNGSILDEEIGIDLADIVFLPVETTASSCVLEANLTGNRRIVRTLALSDSSGFLLNADTNLEGDWHNPEITYAWHGPINQTEQPIKKLNIWPLSMMMRDDITSFKKMLYMGEGERVVIDRDGDRDRNNVYENEGSHKIDANKEGEGGDLFMGDLLWYAVRNKYFMSAAIPVDPNLWTAESSWSNEDDEKWFDFSLSKRVADGSTEIEIYIGPIAYDILQQHNKGLTQSMELSFKFIRPLSIAFLWFLKKLRLVIPNWGLVIIAFSICIKLVLYPLSKKSIDSMRKMSDLQPKITELRKKYANNPQMLNKATMELYKEEGVNPFGGCLPLLLQMPVFFALYPVVGRAFELRRAMFIPGWITDLSRPDPFFILPVAMGISMYFQSKSSMKDPNQKAMLYIMPVMLVIIFSSFSAGLTLYWFMFNVLTFAQQKLHVKH